MTVTWTWRYFCPWGFTSAISGSGTLTIVDCIGASWQYFPPSGASAPSTTRVVLASGSASGRDTYYAPTNTITDIVTPSPNNFITAITKAATTTGYTFTYNDGTVNDGIGSGSGTTTFTAPTVSAPNGFIQFDVDERGFWFADAEVIGTANSGPIPAPSVFSNNAGFGGYWINNFLGPNTLLGLYGGDVTNPPDFFFSGSAPDPSTSPSKIAFGSGRFLSQIQMDITSNIITLSCWDGTNFTSFITASPSNGYVPFNTDAVTSHLFTQNVIFRFDSVVTAFIVVNDPNSGTSNYNTMVDFANGWTLPGPPTNLALTSPDSGLLHVTWSAPTVAPNPALSLYVITVLNGTTQLSTASVSGTTLSSDFSSLPFGVLVTVNVIARNSIGDSSVVSANVTITHNIAAPATSPTFTIAQTATQVTITFAAITGAATYVATFTPSDTTLPTVTASAASSPITELISALKAGASYAVTVYAKNSLGPGPTSSPTTFTVANPVSSSNTILLIAGAVVIAAAAAGAYYYYRFIRHSSATAPPPRAAK